ncbi:hypothetical protein BDV25DRAFT_54485 [Aspergillus avenaceus]|uniref:Zinc finger C2H2 LYAR-type domain-containing protein n=1 Tax=Aspergillus avenaceus TaxID=36643 RepID=A0A5N6TJF7_ASPAV|nr:hypothetical protein BDV25DRAFT_54485 [Aspergillus avenaceus]
MVSFSCEACGDILTKKKLDPHRNQCRGASFTCIDCMVHFQGVSYRSHTSCMTEAQKYEGSLYKPKQQKNQRKGQNAPKQNGNGHRAPYVEDAPESDNSKANAPPAAPTPPVNGEQSQNPDAVNVFDFLVADKTPNASKISLIQPKEQMQMVDHAPSVFETSKALANYDTGAEDEEKQYDLPYEENGYSYGSGPIPPSVYQGNAANASVEFMTPAPKKKKDRSRKDDTGAATSDKKRKRHTEDHEMDVTTDTPMMDAPSSVQNHPGTPMLNHSGLTGGLSRMLRSPSLEGENGHADHPRRRYQDPSSPIKRTRRNDKDTDAGLGISMKNRTERIVSSMFGGSAISENSESRRSKKTQRDRNVSNGQAAPSDSQKSKRKVSAQTDAHPSRRLKQLDYADGSRSASPRGEDGHQVVVYRQPNVPSNTQLQMANHFLSLVNKGPESQRGLSINKVLKRFHRVATDEFDDDRGREQGRSRADHEQRVEDEKDLWRTLRVKRNERGEIVLFM